MVQPLMALARGSLADGCDVREVAVQLVAVIEPGVRARGGALVLDTAGGPMRTSLPAAAVRLAIADLLLAAVVDPARACRCTVTSDPEPTVTVEHDDAVTRDAHVSQVLRRAGVRTGSVADALAFPSA